MGPEAKTGTEEHSFTRAHCHTILESLPCYVTVQDASLRVSWANKRARHDFGPADGRPCHEFYGIDASQCSDCPALKTVEDGQNHSRQVTLKMRQGSRITCLCQTAIANDEQTGGLWVVQTGVDISPITEMKNQLILLGETVAGMAHSIKNIMMGLEGGIYVVNKGLEVRNQKEIQEGWDMVLLNFDKISQIVKDILYCSKPRVPNFQVIQPNRIIREVYELFKETARQYHIQVELNLDENLTEAVIDPAGFHTVLSNLVSNALDACKLDLWKDTHQVEIRSRSGPDGSTVVEVRDNGVGIGKDVREHMFEEFFSSKGDQGTGLGLMVTQKIMREHGGSITFRSRPGQGTTFVATFPRRDLKSKEEIAHARS
ncbi:MAG: ATP-binding protein [Thermodesulfobacteriota bacterium]